jgi:putative tributyrin esterase
LTFEESPGGHEWSAWDQQIQRVLEWLPLRRI